MKEIEKSQEFNKFDTLMSKVDTEIIPSAIKVLETKSKNKLDNISETKTEFLVSKISNEKNRNRVRLIFLIFIIVYGISPIDLIPDIIPILGLCDDISLVITFIGFNIKSKKSKR